MSPTPTPCRTPPGRSSSGAAGSTAGSSAPAVHGARAALPDMIDAGDGVLVVVASVHGQVARPFGAPESMASAMAPDGDEGTSIVIMSAGWLSMDDMLDLSSPAFS